ncbi:unnamed protein product, partial [Mesorhabditis belari]|uniref:SXP/RAL-2 family protein Ani s 5-like cation-binding domain-containing protein n=1 Tax=Mesorhabditis belari TaxID=2138241 RepID=A0AAF3ELN4_9BILA
MNQLVVLSCLIGFVICGPGWNKSGMGGMDGKRGKGHKGMLPFLQNATDQQKNDFMNIVRNQTLTKADIKTQTEQWAANIGGTVQSSFTEFEANMTRWKQESRQNQTNIINQLPAQLQTLQAIQDDMSLTKAQERDQIMQFFGNMTDRNLARAVKFMSMVGMRPMGPRGSPMKGGKGDMKWGMMNKRGPMGMENNDKDESADPEF